MSSPVHHRFTFGGRVPSGVGLLLAATVILSAVTAFGSHWLPLFELAALRPERVFHGELWRLVTWPFIETGPLALLFTCLLLYWFGRDLAELWGSVRLVSVYLGTALAAGVGTCLIALADRGVRGGAYIDAWPIVAALTVAWGLYFPDRRVLIFFVLPVTGLLMAWLTVALTVAGALYFGWSRFLPALIAEGVMLAWLFRRWIASRIRAARNASRVRRELEARRRVEDQRRAASVATAEKLRKIEASDEEEVPPIPEEVQGVLGRILDEVKNEQRAKRERSGTD